MRLVVEEWNEPARNQVLQLGYRPVSEWALAQRGARDSPPRPAGNGGQRMPGPERLQRAPSSEAEPAYLAWATGELSRSARELFPRGWTWRRLTPDDLVQGARQGRLWEAPSGWVLTEEGREALRVSWIATTPEDAPALMRAIVDRAVDSRQPELEIMCPALDWLTEPLGAQGMELHPMTVFGKAIGPRGESPRSLE